MQCDVHDLPVSSDVAAAVGMTMRFFSWAMRTRASAIAELGMPITMSTFSLSYQRRAMPTPTSTLLWKSAVTSSIGLPRTEAAETGDGQLHRRDIARPGVLGIGAGHVVQHADLHGAVLAEGRNAEQDARKH